MKEGKEEGIDGEGGERMRTGAEDGKGGGRDR